MTKTTVAPVPSTSALEILKLPQGIDLPPNTQERVRAIGSIATDIASVVIEAHDIELISESYILEVINNSGDDKKAAVLGRLIQQGLLNETEAKALTSQSEIIPKILNMNWNSRDGRAHNVLSWAYAAYLAEPDKILRFEEDPLNSPEAQEQVHYASQLLRHMHPFIQRIAERGEMLTTEASSEKLQAMTATMLKLGSELAISQYEGEPAPSASRIRETVGMLKEFIAHTTGTFPIYKTLLVVDLFTWLKTIPHGVLKSDEHGYDAYGVVGLNSIGKPQEMRAFVDDIMLSLSDSIDPEIYENLKSKSDHLCLVNEMLATYMAQGGASSLTEMMKRSFEAESALFNDRKQTLGDSYNAEQKTLFEDIKAYLEEAPSQERMLGALCVEAVITQFEGALTDELKSLIGLKQVRKYFGFAQDLPLHDEVRRIEQERSSEARSAKIAELERIIADISARYEVTGKQIRNIDGAKELRRRLELWEEPGSRRAVFTDARAQQLAGISLNLDAYPNLVADLAELERAWIELNSIQKGAHRNGLLASIDTLMEVYEAATQRHINDKQLKPLWELLEELTTPEATNQPEDDGVEPSIDVNAINEQFPHREEIQAFPPKPKITEIEVENIAEDLSQFAESHPRKYAVEWERIQALIRMHTDLKRRGFPVAAHRLLSSKWHPLPHYVLEVKGKGEDNGVVAIVESPVYGNATYVVPAADWRDIIDDFTKKEARDLGAKPRVHVEGKTTEEHRQKLFSDITSRLSS